MKRPFVKWLARLLLLLVVLALLGGATKYWDWRSTRKAGEAQLAVATEDLDANEPGWRTVIMDWNAKRAPKERNGVMRARDLIEGFPEEVRLWCRTSNPTDRIDLNQLIQDGDLPLLKNVLNDRRATVARFHDLISTEAGSGLTLNEAATNPIDEVVERFKAFRSVGGFISFHALQNIMENKPDDAIRDVRALLGVARAVGDDPSLYGQLERMNLSTKASEFTGRVLGTGEPKAGLAELQAELAAALAVEYLAAALPGERLTMDRQYEALDAGRASWLDADSDESKTLSTFSRRGLQWMWYRQHVPAQRAVQHELFSRYARALKTPYPDRLDDLEAVRQRLVSPNRKEEEILLANLSPAIVKVAQNELRTKSTLAHAVVAVACERFRIANGRWPKEVSELMPTYLAIVPLDPFTGGPVTIHRVKNGLVVTGYEFGPDDDCEVGFTIVRLNLYDVKHRRQPAPPVVDAELPDIEQYRNPKP